MPPGGGDRGDRGKGDRGKGQGPGVMGFPPCRYCKLRTHFCVDCPEIVCMKCRQKGHVIARCPNGPACGNCGDQGHPSNECPVMFPRQQRAAASASVDSVPVYGPVSSMSSGVARTAVTSSRKRPAACLGLPPPSASLLQKMEAINSLVASVQQESASEALESRLAALDREEEELRASFDRRMAAIRAKREKLSLEANHSKVLRTGLPDVSALTRRLFEQMAQCEGESGSDNDVEMSESVNVPPVSASQSQSDVGVDVEEPSQAASDELSDWTVVQGKKVSGRGTRGIPPSVGGSRVHRMDDTVDSSPTVASVNQYSALVGKSHDDDDALLDTSDNCSAHGGDVSVSDVEKEGDGEDDLRKDPGASG